jgi:hypothetical protein
VKDISHKLGEEESYRKLFQDNELIAMAANYNPREVKCIINRFTISHYLGKIEPTIFLIIQAFKNRWYEDLYKRLEDREYRNLVIKYAKKKPKARNDGIAAIKQAASKGDTTLPEYEKALSYIDETFWEFVDKSRTKKVPQTDDTYYNQIINVIKDWEVYKEKYRKSAEPIEDIKSVSNQMRQEQTQQQQQEVPLWENSAECPISKGTLQ